MEHILMTREQKELLLKDLSAMLPYGVKVKYECWDEKMEKDIEVVDVLYSINIDNWINVLNLDEEIYIEGIKPYLRPMSSMTEKEKELYVSMFLEYDGGNFTPFPGTVVDWLNKNMFDYNGLIPMCLALEALEGMYNIK